MKKSKSYYSVFYKQSESGIILLVVYVDDIVIIGSDTMGILSLKSLFLYLVSHERFRVVEIFLGC